MTYNMAVCFAIFLRVLQSFSKPWGFEMSSHQQIEVFAGVPFALHLDKRKSACFLESFLYRIRLLQQQSCCLVKELALLARPTSLITMHT